MATLRQFSVNIRRRGALVERNVSKLVRKVALVVDRDLVLSTPVDTGRARSNWQVAAGSAVTREISPYAPGEKLGSAEGANASAAIAQAQAAIVASPDGKEIFISNNVPYILALNRGKSSQAPPGFIEIAIRRGLSLVKGVRVTER